MTANQVLAKFANSSRKLNPHTGLPSVFNSGIIDRIFDDYDWFNVKDSYPYNIKQYKDKDGTDKTDLIFALAGVDKKSVSVKVEEGNLIVLVDKKTEETEAEDTVYLHRGISARSMKIAFNLYNVDVEGITSTFSDGLLTISLPSKKKPVKQIEIN